MYIVSCCVELQRYSTGKDRGTPTGYLTNILTVGVEDKFKTPVIM
jgi:hypothetical protein